MTISRSERLLAMAIAAVTLAMRAVAFFHYRFDSDEPQHLHVAWGWTAGLLQYRDVFDNHAPLFHMAAAPLLRILGERPDILLYMRAPMLALWIIVSVATFAIARRLYDVRIAMWSVLLLNVLPPFFLKSIEFRTDNLWNAFWMIAVAVLVLSRRSTAMFFLAGLLLGGALGVSLKTALLLITLAGAGVVTYAMQRPKQRVHLIAFAVGLVIIPSIIAWYLVSRGAWSNFVDCAFRFNELVAVTRSPILVWTPRLLFVPLMIVVLRIAWRHRDATNARFFFAVATAIFFITLCGFWILISPRDFLPFLPFASMFAVAALVRRPHFARNIAALSIVCLIGVGYYAQWLTNRTREFITMERQVLNLTRPGEPVMDYKGETIYRRRPYYFILEFITRNAILHGLIADTVAEDLVRTGCHVAQADGSQWPDRARGFMAANFLNLGRLRASGQWLAPDGSFSIAIPGEYVILKQDGQAAGSLDGTPYRGARSLAAGMHKFTATPVGERLTCLWAPAFARGFSPFHLRDLDF
jgi:dolichyl-phosphate-mannose-protein mannosyltransferase